MIEGFEIVMRSEFPTRAPSIRDERFLQGDVGSFIQGHDEILWEFAPIETIALSGIISAFMGGLKDVKIRTTVMMKPILVSGSLRTAYEATKDIKATVER
ncbi:hypothetical protein OnM2_004040 [Erysiphe neolycopersici]|uniref:Uncharacterized protein n=1 Tax=Erysiphe neolycopersici TaxID=212602 RepID=A0A420I7L7_9PEZI|nr:hypothetical protein OnM2_004040 [Erysiphe neolycopersici]